MPYRNKILMLPVSSDSEVYEFTTECDFEVSNTELSLHAKSGDIIKLTIKNHSILLNNSMGGKTVFVNLKQEINEAILQSLGDHGNLKVQS